VAARLAAIAVVLAIALPGGAPPAAAQAPTPPAPDAVARTLPVEGEVVVPVGTGEADVRPAGGVWVTLHRVGSGGGRALDSARTDAAGRFGLAYERAPQDSAVFFLSAVHAGITYFSAPLPDGPARGEAAQLVVYDTTSCGAGVRLRGRHIIVGALDSTRRHPVVEVVEITNDSLRTVVAADGAPSWAAPLPAGVQEFRLTGGEISPEALLVQEGQVRLFAPIAPGVKQLTYAYSLPPASFPLALPITAELAVLEVLLEDAAASASGATVAPADTVAIEGRTFRRFHAENAPAASVLRIDVPAPPPDRRALYVTAILIAIGLLMLLALGRSVRRPAAVALGWNGEQGPTPEELARRIAALDAQFQRRRAPTVEERQEYERRRGGLKAQLTDAMARHGRQP
jgi:hypothetical protein